MENSAKEYICLTWDEWVEKYQPTWDSSCDFLPPDVNPLTVWTEVDGCDGGTTVLNGYHYVNRLGYFITEVPYDPSLVIYVVEQEGNEETPTDDEV